MANIEKTRELQYKIMQDMAAGALIPIMRIGDELDLFTSLFKFGPCNSDDFSNEVKMDKRYIREWLLALAAAGYINYNPESKSFSLSEEQFSVLGDENSISLMIGGFENLAGAIHNIDIIKGNFKNGKGTGWGNLHPCCLSGSARFFKPSYSIFLIKKWLPSIDGVDEILTKGATLADIGCGHGYSTSLIAEKYNNSKIIGIDPHKPSIDEAKKNNRKLTNLEFRVNNAKNYEGKYDIICFFDCLHDMGDPLGAIKYAKTKLNLNGIIMLVEPTADDLPENNFNLIGQMYYSFSTIACIPASKSQEVGLALGAQAGPKKLFSILNDAGFKNTKVTYKTASNMVIQGKLK
ncbi:class I SAM-dependent methyltransferase [Alphaproteobacteria bacterium]|nr:class I SAM-dependent methyltransferase [Alphaproteobacteria bacterium]